MYTASFAFFEALIEAGITHCFVNLGSDHPSIMEAMVKGQEEKTQGFPRVITCPNEMVAMSMADGYARRTGKPQCVIFHVDVGTSALGPAMHNASTGRAPILVFAGLSPYTLEGEYRGSRTEYIHWLQDIPDQKAIVAQYCRFTGEIKGGRNVKQLVNRVLSFAMADPKGPVYLTGACEAMEEEIEESSLNQRVWTSPQLGGLSDNQRVFVTELLANAERPLVIVGYTGREHGNVGLLVELANCVPGMAVLDTAGADMCFPASHPACFGVRFGEHEAIEKADVLASQLRTIWVIEAVTNTTIVADQIQAEIPGSWINCGGGGLGWSGGGALGVKLAADIEASAAQSWAKPFVCQIVGDGSFMFTVPSSVYWIAHRYGIPVLTVVLNNKDWNAPRKSLLLVHPDGAGSAATNEELNIAFSPAPDYTGIAVSSIRLYKDYRH